MNMEKLKRLSKFRVIQNKVQKNLQQHDDLLAQVKEEIQSNSAVTATRKDYQVSRRLFHMGNGFVVATAYGVMLSHQQIIYILGTFACLLYLFDQVRISYPELSKHFEGFTKYLMRAEEQLKESAMIPYVIAILLCILSMPKLIAISSIYTLAFADPLSALFGIRFGKHKIVREKSLEGSLAFFATTFLAISIVFLLGGVLTWKLWVIAFIVASLSSIFEMIPIRLDDNLTIPLFTGYTLWIFCAIMGVSI